MGSQPKKPTVHRATTAKGSKVDDQKKRMRQYTLMMTIRFVCFFLLLVTPGNIKYLWLLGAIVLPYIAVLVANNHGEAHPGELTSHEEQPAPPAAVTMPTPVDDDEEEVLDVIVGEVVHVEERKP